MVLYAFDGKWNEDEADEAKETNVLKFCKCLPLDMRVFYLEGVGTRIRFIGKLLGGLSRYTLFFYPLHLQAFSI